MVLNGFIHCKPVCVLRKVLWVVAARGRVIASRRFERTYCHHLQSYESEDDSGMFIGNVVQKLPEL
jgi:hypothetical protein